MKRIILVWMVLGCTVYGAGTDKEKGKYTNYPDVKKESIRSEKHQDVRKQDLLRVFLEQIISDVLVEKGAEHRFVNLPNYVAPDLLEKMEKSEPKVSFAKDELLWITGYKIQGKLKPNEVFAVAANGFKFKNSKEAEKTKKDLPLIVAQVKYFEPGEANLWGFELEDVDFVTDSAQAEKIWKESKPWPEDFKEE